MAITKIIGAIHGTGTKNKYKILKNTLEYILDPSKTGGGLYAGCLNCHMSQALQDMAATNKRYHKEPKKKTDRVGYHYCIAWPPSANIDEKTALKIGEEFCRILYNDRECVYGVHNDKGHMHLHICFNSVSYMDGYKFKYCDGDWEKVIQPVTDKLCRKYGLNTLQMDKELLGLDETQEEMEERRNRGRMRAGQKRRNRKVGGRGNTKYYNEKNEGYSKPDHLRADLDDAVYRAESWERFLEILREKGYQYKQGKYFAVWCQGMERYRRTYKLGDAYSEEMLKERIRLKDKPFPYQDSDNREYFFDREFKERMGKIRFSKAASRVYAIQYQKGLLKPGQNRAYAVINQAMREIKRTELEEKFLKQHGIDTISAGKEFVAGYDEKLKEWEKEKEEFYQSLIPYRPLMKMWKNVKDYEQDYDSYLECMQEEGGFVFEDGYRKFQDFLDVLEMNGMGYQGFIEFMEHVRDKKQSFYKQRRELLKEKKVVLDYIQRYAEQAETVTLKDNEEICEILVESEQAIGEDEAMVYFHAGTAFLAIPKEDVSDYGGGFLVTLYKQDSYSVVSEENNAEEIRGDILYEEFFVKNNITKQKAKER